MFAKSVNDIKTIFENYGATVFNFVFADDENNIGYYAPPLIPIRPNIYSAVRGVKEGWSG